MIELDDLGASINETTTDGYGAAYRAAELAADRRRSEDLLRLLYAMDRDPAGPPDWEHDPDDARQRP